MNTERLILRRWRRADREAFAAINADPHVMRYFPAVFSRTESDAAIDAMESHFEERGYGLWAAEIRATGELAGCAGLLNRDGRVEIGCRLGRAHWRHGYATEALTASLRSAFVDHLFPEVTAIASPANAAARRVVEKLGFTHHHGDDYYSPHLPSGHPLRPLMLFRLPRHRWHELYNDFK